MRSESPALPGPTEAEGTLMKTFLDPNRYMYGNEHKRIDDKNGKERMHVGRKLE
jgi:hypothetical protein